jgi:Ca2+-binding RTX toxin-like protein
MRKLIVAGLAGVLLSFAPTISGAQPPATCFGDDVNDGRATDADDYLTGSPTRDVISLGDGADQYFSSDGPDELCGNLGNDLLVGEGGNDSLDGDEGDDVLIGMGQGDVLKAGAGVDSVDGGNGADTLRTITDDGVQDDIYDGNGTDTIVGNAEDVWHRCGDDQTDNHSGFNGQIIPDPNC